jgi:hypothetical protein
MFQNQQKFVQYYRNVASFGHNVELHHQNFGQAKIPFETPEAGNFNYKSNQERDLNVTIFRGFRNYKKHPIRNNFRFWKKISQPRTAGQPPLLGLSMLSFVPFFHSQK